MTLTEDTRSGAVRRRAERVLLSAALAWLAACSPHHRVRVAPSEVKAARAALARCFREQHLSPCSEHGLEAMRETCADRSRRDPTLRDQWIGEWLFVTVHESHGALDARILAANGHDELATESARKLADCMGREPPLHVELDDTPQEMVRMRLTPEGGRW